MHLSSTYPFWSLHLLPFPFVHILPNLYIKLHALFYGHFEQMLAIHPIRHLFAFIKAGLFFSSFQKRARETRDQPSELLSAEEAAWWNVQPFGDRGGAYSHVITEYCLIQAHCIHLDKVSRVENDHDHHKHSYPNSSNSFISHRASSIQQGLHRSCRPIW